MDIVVILPNRDEYLSFEILKGLTDNHVKIFTSSIQFLKVMTHVWARGQEIGLSRLEKCVEVNDIELIKRAKTADYIFVLGSKYKNKNSNTCGGKFYLLDEINFPEKTVFIDGSEWTASGWKTDSQNELLNYNNKNIYKDEPWIDYQMRKKAKWYFKRETYREDYLNYGIIPLPYPVRVEDQQKNNPPEKRKFDLLISFGQLETGLRSEILNFSKKNSKFNIFNKFTSQKKFFENILNSYLVADSWGAGNCTVRAQMVLINSVALIQQKWKILNPFPFTDNVNIINYSNIFEFSEKITFYLKNKKNLIEIGKKGFLHAKKYHTTKKRLDYIFNILNGKFKLNEHFGETKFRF